MCVKLRFALLMFVSLVCGGALAATNTWVGPDSGNWSTKTNWSANTIPGGSDAARFVRKSGVFTVALDSNQSAGSVGFDDSAFWRIAGSDKTLTVESLLEFIGSSSATQQLFEPHLSGNCALIVDGAWLGLLNSNAYAGGTTISADGVLYGQAQTGGNSPFGPTNCSIALKGGAIRLNATNSTTSTSLGAMTLDGYGRLQINAGSFSSTSTLSMASLSMTSTSRDTAVPGYRRDVLHVYGTQNSLTNKERIIVADGMDATNKLPGYYIVSPATPGSTSADFATYDSNKGFGKFTNYVTANGTWSNITNSDMVVYNGADATLSGTNTIWGLKMYNDVCMISGTATVNVDRGGIIVAQIESMDSVNTKGFGSGITIVFGDNEGIVFTQNRVSTYRSPYDRDAGGPAYYNRLFMFNNRFTGNNGLTIHGPGLMRLENVNVFAGVSGPITVHQAWLICPDSNITFTNEFVMDGANVGYGKWSGGAGTLTFNGNITLLNGGLLICPDRSYANIVNLNGKISGIGALRLDGPSTFTLKNSTNDYSGGTSLLSLVDPVQVAGRGALGTGPIDIAAGGTLTFNATPDGDWSLTNGLSGYGTVQVESGSNTTYTLTVAGQTISPGDDNDAGTLTINGRLKLDSAGATNSTLLINLNATNDYDRLKVNGSLVNLANVNLSLDLGYTPSNNDEFYILLNDGSDAIIGTFAGLPEGARIHIMNSRYRCRISYSANGDDGAAPNDVKLHSFVYVVAGTTVEIK